MRRASLALAGSVALLLLVAPLVDAAAHGARPPISVGQTVSDVALASLGNRFAAANSDPGSRLTGNPSSPTWTLWNIDGSARSVGGADPVSCPNPPTGATEDCDTDATHIAVSSNGAKVAVAGRVMPGGDSTLTVFTDAGTRLKQVVVPGAIQDLALDADGARVAAVSAVSTGNAANPEDGYIGLWTADSSMTVVIEKADLPLGVTSLDLTADLLVAGAGTTHYLFSLPGDDPYTASSISGDVLDVDAAATHTTGWSVAGYSSGFFALFSDRDSSGHDQPSVPDYQKREAGETSAVNAVAIRDDASAFAVGHEAGRLRLYSLDPATGLPDTSVSLLAELSGLGGIDDLAFSANGRYLAVRSDSTVRLYHTGTGALQEMWVDTRTAVADSLAIDGDGDHVLIGSGTSVILYDAVHAITASVPSASQQPGTTHAYDLVYRNDGNRADSLTLTAAPPAGVSTTVEPSSFTLLPAVGQQVTVTVTVPATQPAGSLRIPITAQVNGGTDGSQVKDLALTVPLVRSIAFETDVDSVGANLGGAAVFDITATNEGNVAEDVQLLVPGLTGGWTASFEPSQLTLGPGESEEVRVSLQPPAGLANGARIDVELTHGGADPNPLPLTATVGAIFNMKVTAPVGTTIQPGVPVLVNVTVRNDGNTRDSAVVSLAALPAGWVGGFVDGVGEFDVRDLEPCATNAAACSQVVQMTLRAPADYDSEVPVQITITAKSVGDEAKTSTAGLLVTVAGPQTVTDTETEAGGGGGGSGIPGPAPFLAVLALALAALARRRIP